MRFLVLLLYPSNPDGKRELSRVEEGGGLLSWDLGDDEDGFLECG